MDMVKEKMELLKEIEILKKRNAELEKNCLILMKELKK